MKPIRLIVQAFGPYADTQEFDFRKLSGHEFFLIHGDTGAGKSTVLDALCYALYGESSGGERNGEQLRSQHAPPARSTWVRLDFAVGDELFRVFRAPGQERPKRRGGGTTWEQPTATLWRRTGCENDDEDGEVRAERVEKVNAEITQVLGFSSGQFRQVVVLPQGQFREFLIAGSKDREPILSMLFHTDEYQAVAQALKAMANEAGQASAAVREQQRGVLAVTGVETLAALEQQCADRAGALAVAEGQLGDLQTAAHRAAARLAAGQEADRLLRARTTAEEAVAALEVQRAEMERKRIALHRARLAAGLSDVDQALRERLDEATAADARLADAQGAYDQVLATLVQAEATLAAEQQREGERMDAQTQLACLQALVDQVAGLENERRSAEETQRRVAALAQQRALAQTALDRWQRTLVERNQTAQPLRDLATQRELARLRAEQAITLHLRRIQLNELDGALAQADRDATAAAEWLVEQERRLEAARADLEQCERAWRDGQAAILARTLVTGEPCPVCGSDTHPHPAFGSEDLPTERVIDTRKRTVRSREAEVEQARSTLSERRQALAGSHAERQALVDQLGAAYRQPLEAITAQRAAAQDYDRTTAQAVEQLPAIEQEIVAAQAQVAEADASVQQLDQQERAAAAQLEAALAILAARQQAIPAPLRDPGAFAQALTGAEQTFGQFVQALDQAQQEVTQARIAIAASGGALAEQTQASKRARERAEEQRRAFAARVIQSGFANEDDCRSAALPAGKCDQLDADLRDYDGHRASVERMLAEATAAAEGIQAPDLEVLQATCDQAQRAYEALLAQVGTLRSMATQSEHALGQAHALERTAASLEARYALVGRLAAVACGERPYGISFQRFMLGALLDEVLINASERLRRMSRERYVLQRAIESTDRRRAMGLDLEILDGYTGQTRAAKTLSGGESFLAALALALGLADIVQSRAGGVHLDTMFIDEGFGALDDASLDLAIQTLMDLQQSGRLVGIISHVAELRQRVPARLEVASTPVGSTARFVVIPSP